MFRRLVRKLRGRPAPRPRASGPATPASSPPSARPAGIGMRLGVPEPDQPRELVLYKFDACPYCRRVQTHLAHLGIPVDLRDTRTDPNARASLRQQTGRTQVPCLFIDGQPLFESEDINAWLDAYATLA